MSDFLRSINGVRFFMRGEKILQRKLAELPDKIQEKVAIYALRSGMTVYKSGIKKVIPGHLKDIRKAIGSTVVKNKKTKGMLVAKAGGSVAIKKSAQQEHERSLIREHRQSIKRHGGLRIAGLAMKPGVGISARNVHWWLAGTKQRKQKTTGRSTGRMPKAQSKPVQTGMRQAAAAANRKIKARLIAGIRRESAKLLKGGNGTAS